MTTGSESDPLVYGNAPEGDEYTLPRVRREIPMHPIEPIDLTRFAEDENLVHISKPAWEAILGKVRQRSNIRLEELPSMIGGLDDNMANTIFRGLQERGYISTTTDKRGNYIVYPAPEKPRERQPITQRIKNRLGNMAVSATTQSREYWDIKTKGIRRKPSTQTAQGTLQGEPEAMIIVDSPINHPTSGSHPRVAPTRPSVSSRRPDSMHAPQNGDVPDPHKRRQKAERPTTRREPSNPSGNGPEVHNESKTSRFTAAQKLALEHIKGEYRTDQPGVTLPALSVESLKNLFQKSRLHLTPEEANETYQWLQSQGIVASEHTPGRGHIIDTAALGRVLAERPGSGVI